MIKLIDLKWLFAFLSGVLVGAILHATLDPGRNSEFLSQVSAPTTAVVRNVTSTAPASIEGLLSPPEYYMDLPNPLRTNSKAEVRVAWTPVNGAKRYVVVVEEPNGTHVKTYKTNWHVIYLKEVPLPSGSKGATYRVRVAAINEKDEQSAYGSERTLLVRPQTSIVAPKVQEIRVED